MANLLLFFLTMLVNSKLTPISLYAILLGPMVILPAVSFKSPSLILCCMLTGLSIDAMMPGAYGVLVFGLPIIGLVIRSVRNHFRMGTSYHFVLLAHISNFACIALISVSQGIYTGHLLASSVQIVAIGLLSHTILFAVAPWFFSFERCILQLISRDYANQDEFLEP